MIVYYRYFSYCRAYIIAYYCLNTLIISFLLCLLSLFIPAYYCLSICLSLFINAYYYVYYYVYYCLLLRLLLCLLYPAMFVLVFITFLANLTVLVSFLVEKKLRTTFSALIANLAFADMLVAITAMDFYTVNVMYGYWPFGKILCGIWVVFDYDLVFASCYTLAAIAVDRMWSIKWSIHYRQHNSMRKAIAFILCIWFVY